MISTSSMLWPRGASQGGKRSRQSAMSAATEPLGRTGLRRGSGGGSCRAKGSSSQNVLFKPLSGILNQRKYLPIRLMPITIELQLVDNPLTPIVSHMGAQGFADTDTSTQWQIMNVQLKCDLVTLDSGLNESYIKLLEEGKN